MSAFWSSWITIISLACWLLVIVFLAWNMKDKPTLDDDGTTGHSYDGIREFDKPMPKWWLIIFWGTLVWAALYFVLFPALAPGSWTGITTVKVDGKNVPWTSHNELASELEANNKVFIDTFNNKLLQDATAIATVQKIGSMQKQLATDDNAPASLKGDIDKEVAKLGPYVEKLAADPHATKIGSRLFLQNCALCHGSQAKGATGYPNLTDNDWLYGGDATQIMTTIHKGRQGAMVAWSEQLGEKGVAAAAEYVLSLSGRSDLDANLVSQGQQIFNTNCAVCHGQDAKGNYAFGAPNLTDQIWLYGDSREVVTETIANGRSGVMPAWTHLLGTERAMLLAAYVYSMSHDANTDSIQ